MTRLSDRAYTDLLAGIFAVIWVLLAIDPLYRHDWMLENLLVVGFALAFLWWRKSLELSKISATLIFVFLVRARGRRRTTPIPRCRTTDGPRR